MSLLATVILHHPHGDEQVRLRVSSIREERDVETLRNEDGTVREILPGAHTMYHLEGTYITEGSVDVQSFPMNGGVRCDTSKGACACGATH